MKCAHILFKHNVDADLNMDLVQAMYYNRLEMISLIIDNGGDPDHKWWKKIPIGGRRYQTSPLLLATKSRDGDIAKLLFERGADCSWAMKQLNGSNPNGYRDDEGARFLCEIKYPWQPASIQIGSGDLEELRKMARESSTKAQAEGKKAY